TRLRQREAGQVLDERRGQHAVDAPLASLHLHRLVHVARILPPVRAPTGEQRSEGQLAVLAPEPGGALPGAVASTPGASPAEAARAAPNRLGGGSGLVPGGGPFRRARE